MAIKGGLEGWPHGWLFLGMAVTVGSISSCESNVEPMPSLIGARVGTQWIYEMAEPGLKMQSTLTLKRRQGKSLVLSRVVNGRPEMSEPEIVVMCSGDTLKLRTSPSQDFLVFRLNASVGQRWPSFEPSEPLVESVGVAELLRVADLELPIGTFKNVLVILVKHGMSANKQQSDTYYITREGDMLKCVSEGPGNNIQTTMTGYSQPP